MSAGDHGEPRASTARVYQAWLGGANTRQPDRAIAEEIMQIQPETARMARANRAFIGRAVTWTAREGITQFLDLGAGLPTADSIHRTAQAVAPDARVVYVDNDAAAVTSRRTHDKADGVAAVLADVLLPSAVLAETGQLLDLAEPVCAIFGAIAHFWAPAQARQVVAEYAAALAPGSVFAVSVARNEDPEAYRRIRDAFMPSGLVLHRYSARDVEQVLAGLDLVPPGAVRATAWRPGWQRVAAPSATAYTLVAVARKPVTG